MLEHWKSAGSEDISAPNRAVADVQLQQFAVIQQILAHCTQPDPCRTEQCVDFVWNGIASVVGMAHEACGTSSVEESDFCEHIEPLLEELLNLRDELADATHPRHRYHHSEAYEDRACECPQSLPEIIADVQNALRRLLFLAGEDSDGAQTPAPDTQATRTEQRDTTCPASVPFAPRGIERRERQEVLVHIRWMIRRDMAEVLQIEDESFEFPWLEEDFIRCLRQRNCIGMVAEHDDRVAGFMIYELHKTRIHLLNFAVAEQMRRRGIGSQMVDKLIAKLSVQRRSSILTEVRETNLGAQLFFRENGFRAVSVLRDFYEDTPEDAYLMQYRYRPGQEKGDYTPVNRISRLAG